MLCLGSVYAWSIIAAELIRQHGLSASQSQVVFGLLIAIFPATMILVGELEKKTNLRNIGYLSGLLFFSGYLLASFSGGAFLIILAGIGVLTGIATGLGYWIALTSPVLLFPDNKGIITGIAAAGFGLGAVFMSAIAEAVLYNGYNVLQLLRITGISYGLIIIAASRLIHPFRNKLKTYEKPLRTSHFTRSKIFRKLFFGIFLGTFAGLLIIGNLGIIGGQQNISDHNLVRGVALFAIANFSGRLIWGFLSDYTATSLTIFFALLFQSLAIISLHIFVLSDISYLILAFLAGFGFGGNFVVFAKETAEVFGVSNLGIIYPYVFLGYAIAGIAGPVTGGLLYDFYGSFSQAIILSGLVSLAGSLLFLHQFVTSGKNDQNN